MNNLDLIVALQSTLGIVLISLFIGRFIDVIIKIIKNIMSRRLGSEFTLLFFNRLTFVGTIHHELAHAIILLITGAKITKLEIFKPKDNRLGQVAYINRGNFIFRSIQNTLSAIAPVIIGCFSEYLLYILLGNVESILVMVIIWYVMISILLHMTMSKQDLKMALKGLPICVLIIFAIMYITKFNIINTIENLV